MVALTGATTITVSVVGLFAFLAILALLRVLLRRSDPTWRTFRVGFFLERDPLEPDVDEILQSSQPFQEAK